MYTFPVAVRRKGFQQPNQQRGFGLLPHLLQPACSAGFVETAGHAGRQPVDDTNRSEKRESGTVGFCLDKELPFSQEVWLPTMCVCVKRGRVPQGTKKSATPHREAQSFCVFSTEKLSLNCPTLKCAGPPHMSRTSAQGCFHVCLHLMECERMRTLSNRNLWCIVQSICKISARPAKQVHRHLVADDPTCLQVFQLHRDALPLVRLFAPTLPPLSASAMLCVCLCHPLLAAASIGD